MKVEMINSIMAIRSKSLCMKILLIIVVLFAAYTIVNDKIIINHRVGSSNRSVSERVLEHDGTGAIPGSAHANVTGNTGQVRVLVVGGMRTGSSFVGALLDGSGSKDMLYIYEPGLAVYVRMASSKVGNRIITNVYLNLISRLFHCDFIKLDFFLKTVSNSPPDVLLRVLAPRLHYDACPDVKAGCNITPEAATDVCRKSKYIGIKTVRVPDLNLLMPLVEDQAVQLRLIHLVRDPRAMLVSFAVWPYWRQVHPKHNLLAELDSTMTGYISNYCKYHWQNFEMGRRTPSLQRGQYMFLRYEDAASDPMAAAERIHRFIGRTDGVPDTVARWIDSHTQDEDPKKKFERKSNETHYAWRLRISLDLAQKVQDLDYCPGMMAAMGYRPVLDGHHLMDLSKPLFGDIPQEYKNKYDYFWS